MENAINSCTAAECIQPGLRKRRRRRKKWDLRHKTMFTKLKTENYEQREHQRHMKTDKRCKSWMAIKWIGPNQYKKRIPKQDTHRIEHCVWLCIYLCISWNSVLLNFEFGVCNICKRRQNKEKCENKIYSNLVFWYCVCSVNCAYIFHIHVLKMKRSTGMKFHFTHFNIHHLPIHYKTYTQKKWQIHIQT